MSTGGREKELHEPGMIPQEMYLHILGQNCKCGRAKLAGYVWCETCWSKLPLYMQNRLNDAMGAILSHVKFALMHLEKK